MSEDAPKPSSETATTDRNSRPSPIPASGDVAEIGGPTGPEPTRFGDWEKGGRCSDF